VEPAGGLQQSRSRIQYVFAYRLSVPGGSGCSEYRRVSWSPSNLLPPSGWPSEGLWRLAPKKSSDWSHTTDNFAIFPVAYSAAFARLGEAFEQIIKKHQKEMWLILEMLDPAPLPVHQVSRFRSKRDTKSGLSRTSNHAELNSFVLSSSTRTQIRR